MRFLLGVCLGMVTYNHIEFKLNVVTVIHIHTIILENQNQRPRFALNNFESHVIFSA